MVYQHNDYRQFLKTVLAERIAKNPKYSLRAMARSFSISPALLSQISNGQRNLTAMNAVRLSKKLGLSKRESDYFCSLVQYQDAKHLESKALLLEKLNALRAREEVHDMETDAFKTVSEWYHFAIIGMLKIKRFKATPREISRRLGVSMVEVELALERLTRLKLIEPLPDGGYKATYKHLKFESREKNLALQSFHRQMMEKAIGSLTTQSPQEKHVGSETFALDPALIPEAQKRINEFLDDMSEFASKDPNPSETYHLGVQFFRLTRKDEP